MYPSRSRYLCGNLVIKSYIGHCATTPGPRWAGVSFCHEYVNLVLFTPNQTIKGPPLWSSA